jgi:REP-associated tyrosine transposase
VGPGRSGRFAGVGDIARGAHSGSGFSNALDPEGGSTQSNHIHLICEADDRRALSRGLQGLTIRIARGFNRELGRKGALFAQRYYARILRTPAEVRNCLCYVLNNARHHRREGLARDWIDGDATSARWFTGWRYPIRDMRLLQDDGEAPVVAGTAWLLTTGWRRRGLIRFDETPG